MFARSSGHVTSAGIHQLLQRGKGFHRVGLGGGDLGEQRCANGDFEAVLQIDRDQVHGSGLDGWAETACDSPEYRALAGAGAADGQRVPPRDAQRPRRSVLAATQSDGGRHQLSGGLSVVVVARCWRITNSMRTVPGATTTDRAECAPTASRIAGTAFSRSSTVWPVRVRTVMRRQSPDTLHPEEAGMSPDCRGCRLAL